MLKLNNQLSKQEEMLRMDIYYFVKTRHIKLLLNETVTF